MRRLASLRVVEFDNFRVYAAPRVGLSWFTLSCMSVGLSPVAHTSASKTSLCIVRHPYIWLQSMYANMVIGNSSSCFAEFILRHVCCYPDVVRDSMLYQDADSVIRLEDFPWAVSSWLMPVCDAAVIDGVLCTPPTNVTPTVDAIDSRLLYLVTQSEKRMCEEYEYGCGDDKVPYGATVCYK